MHRGFKASHVEHGVMVIDYQEVDAYFWYDYAPGQVTMLEHNNWGNKKTLQWKQVPQHVRYHFVQGC